MNEFTLWGLPAGSADRIDEQVLTSTADRQRIETVKAMASVNGWHSFRVQTLDGLLPDFAAAVVANNPASNI